MPFDYKKEYRELYSPLRVPVIVTVPPMNFIAVRGKGNPNEEGGTYQKALQLLYGLAYTIKMSPKTGHDMEGYFAYVVPPLEGFWWMEGMEGGEIDYTRKDDFCWISCIRLPEFVTHEEFEWAVGEATRKKKLDFSPVEFLTVNEGLCVQCMHVGPYDDEPSTIDSMHMFVRNGGYELDFNDKRFHHEIYLSDARRTAPNKLRTVVRHPIR